MADDTPTVLEQAKDAHGRAVQQFREANVGPELAEAGLQLAATLHALIAAVRAESADSVHYANGVADLAMRERETLKAHIAAHCIQCPQCHDAALAALESS
jgi:hypothetical protein